MTPDESVTVKGSPVRSLQQFIEQNLTAGQRETVFANLPPEYVARLRSPILPTEQIPVHMLNRFAEEAAKVKGEPLEQFARSAGRYSADQAIKGVYRFFALVLTPSALLSKAGQMWGSLNNRGQLRVENQQPTSAKIILDDYPSEIALCSRVEGWIEKMAELTGAKNIQINHSQCFARGGKRCEWELHWK